MIRRRLPLLLLVALVALATPAVAFELNETHGSTWVTWEWNVSALEPGQVLIARYDGAEVVNQSAGSPPPLVQMYAKTGIGPNEPHSFEVILLDTDPAVAVNETDPFDGIAARWRIPGPRFHPLAATASFRPKTLPLITVRTNSVFDARS